jgi:hypothetical protein
MKMLLALCLALAFTKPTVSLEQSCEEAGAIAVVEQGKTKGAYRVVDILYDGTGQTLKSDTEMDVDLKGMTYEPAKKYILFLAVDKDKKYFAVAQMRTEDSKGIRERIAGILKKTGKVK